MLIVVERDQIRRSHFDHNRAKLVHDSWSPVSPQFSYFQTIQLFPVCLVALTCPLTNLRVLPISTSSLVSFSAIQPILNFSCFCIITTIIEKDNSWYLVFVPLTPWIISNCSRYYFSLDDSEIPSCERLQVHCRCSIRCSTDRECGQWTRSVCKEILAACTFSKLVRTLP
jgi:hypothetical protein